MSDSLKERARVLIDQAYPEHKCPSPVEIEIDPDKWYDSHEVELCRQLFNGGDWCEVEFPDENQFVECAFDLLPIGAQTYYYAAYMTQAMDNPYYRIGALHKLEMDASSLGIGTLRYEWSLWESSGAMQHEAIAAFVRALENPNPSRLPSSDQRLAHELRLRIERLINGS